MSVNEKMTAIADAIRAKTGKTEALNLNQMAESVPEVFEAGKKSEYDAFWDNIQENGNRTDYAVAFGSCWNKDNFKPKYSLRPTNAYMMFFSNTSYYIDLGEVAENYFDALGIELDYSKAINVTYGIAKLHAKRFKKLDFSSATSTAHLFYSHNWGGLATNNDNSVEEIDEFVSSEITTYENSTFQHAIWLREIRFTGVIAKGVVDFHWCTKLSKASIESIVNALSPNTSGLTCTLSQTAVNNAFTTSDWNTLKDTKTNWNIALV